MATTLNEYVRDNPCKGFSPRPVYFRDGDFVTYFVDDQRAYAVRVDELLTVYRACGTNKLVGCKIKGVRRLLKEGGAFGVIVADGAVTLGMLFSTAHWLSERREAAHDSYRELISLAGRESLDRSELPFCAA